MASATRRQAARGAGPRRWHEAAPAPVVVVTGPESLLADRAVSRVRRLAREQSPDLEVVGVDAAAYASGQLTVWMSPSLFAEPRLVMVSGVEGASDAFVADATALLAGPLPDDVMLVLRHGGGQRARKLIDAAASVAGALVVDCPAVKSPTDQRSFVDTELRSAGLGITGEAADALLLAVGADLRALAAACSQLAADVPALHAAEPDQPRSRPLQITADDVDRYYGGRAEVSGFKVADAAVAGQRDLALRLLRQALDGGLDPVPLVAALAAKLRAMIKVSGAGRGNDYDIARDLSLAPWQVQRARSDLRGWTPDGMAAAMIALAEADAAVKGGFRDGRYGAERAVLDLISARASVDDRSA